MRINSLSRALLTCSGSELPRLGSWMGARTIRAGIQIGERWHPPEIAEIDRWIASQGDQMTRGQAIRRLVELRLEVQK